jgi:MSHA biogenesis protein MshE
MINQVQVHEKIDLGFERVLRSALRQDPDVILVGEMRDEVTAEIGMRASITGHMVLSTLHTNDAMTTPIRLLDMGVPRYMVAMSLQLVLAQRLVRVVCDNCAQPYQPTPNELAWLKAELGEQAAEHTYMQGAGCGHCGRTGYQGRTGVYEMLEMTGPVVDAANQPDPGIFLRVAREQMAGNTLRRDAVRVVHEGRTTVQEAMRVTNEYVD